MMRVLGSILWILSVRVCLFLCQLYCIYWRVMGYHVEDDIARLYVKEHVIPSDRAGIDYILKKLRFPYYDEIFS